MKRALITGGAGFLGSHLGEALVLQGYEVICVDNLITGFYANIAHLIDCPGFSFLQQDIRYPLQIPEPIDIIFNMACPASPAKYQKHSLLTLETSFTGTLALLELAREHGSRFIQASTSEVYGDPNQHPQTEEYRGNVSPVGPRACYDEAKRVAETLCAEFRRQYGLDTKIVRIFNTYGPRMHRNDGRIVSNFITQALAGKPITLYGDGTHTRSFCYVGDLIDGILRMAATPQSIRGPVNLGNPVEYTVKQAADIIIRCCNSNSPITHVSLPEDDPRQRCPDIRLARDILGWEPKISFEEGLAETIGYFTSSEG